MTIARSVANLQPLMKKEVVLAITIGFGLGLIITYGVWLANKSLKDLPKSSLEQLSPTPAQTPETTTPTTPTPSTNTSTSPKPANNSLVKITSPEDEWLADKDSTTVKGTAPANSTVTITYEDSETIVVADASGNFSATIPLSGGYNLITATAFDTLGNSSSATITVTYTTSKI